MAKKGALDAAPEDDKEDIGDDTIFAGADEHEHEDADENADRGDMPSDEAIAAAEKLAEADDEDEVEAPPAKAAAEAEDGDADETPEQQASDEESDEDAEDEVADDKVSNYVSKDRFNALNDRMKLAEQALVDKENELAQEAPQDDTPKFDFDGKEVEYMELVTDGEFEKAKTIRQEIRAAERADMEADAAQAANNTTARVNEQIAFSNKIEELSEEYDHFNPKHDDYDQTLVDEAVDRRDLFIARGMSLADALDKAAREVAKLYDVPSNFEKAADEEIERLAQEDKGKAPAKKKVDVKKKVEQASKQPPTMDEGSAQEEQQSATSMTDAEFEALPESTKARMRGDIL